MNVSIALDSHLVVINGIIKTCQIEDIENLGEFCEVRFRGSDKVYRYSSDKVRWLRSPHQVDISEARVYVKGALEKNIAAVNCFPDGVDSYYAVIFKSGYVRQCCASEVCICRSCITDRSAGLLSYFGSCVKAGIIRTSEDEPDASSILASVYERLSFIDERSAAALYMSGRTERAEAGGEFLFPFGCNASQQRAVVAAFENRISVIKGPPGTGKTQTILNIIANLLVRGQSVMVVSNNNSAIANVLEKLDKYGLGFVVAPLGRRENRERFIEHQPPVSATLSEWELTDMEAEEARRCSALAFTGLSTIFSMREELAGLRQELAEVEAERRHFMEECGISDVKGMKNRGLTSTRLLELLDLMERWLSRSSYDRESRGIRRLFVLLQRIRLKLVLRFRLGVSGYVTDDELSRIMSEIETRFYNTRVEEINCRIAQLEADLSSRNAAELMVEMTDSSMRLLRGSMARRYGKGRRRFGSVAELYNGGDELQEAYPVVLSTTFSARQCFNDSTLFDFIIMDEASQVSVETGLLALTCARNAVIVGDPMQLSNVIKDDIRARLEAVRLEYNVADGYDCASHSFLSSVIDVVTNVPVTMLREHYRCHPEIINFCNQRFYGGELVIMTEKTEGEQAMMAIMTSKGHHARGRYNQREIDTVKEELLPMFGNLDDIGIIAPYRKQAEEFNACIPEVEAATIHKYQGREKGTVIMSVTDDIITSFVDDAHLINVAVSRAKHRFCLVMSGNRQKLKGNINDLVGYIRYHNGPVMHSRLRSIFDYLYTCADDRRRTRAEKYSKVSGYESEVLTYRLLRKIRREHPEWSHIKVIPHYPVRSLIGDMSELDDEHRRYALCPRTHVDFILFNRVSKEPLLAIETDGYHFHQPGSRQGQRDVMKNHILDICGLPLLRLSTVGHSEEQRIVEALRSVGC